ncbi:hypothetical protein ACPXCS_38310 [Streptomyces sp. DT190]|uniref:hypothetical protein n=1 Tax=unclassified Streptomyces TaxID=2593676 RepID=UPI003CF0C58A
MTLLEIVYGPRADEKDFRTLLVRALEANVALARTCALVGDRVAEELYHREINHLLDLREREAAE